MKEKFSSGTRAMLLGVSGVLMLGLASGVRADETNTTAVTPTLAQRTEASLSTNLPQTGQIAQAQESAILGAALTAPKARQLDPVAVASKVVPIAIRLGAMVSPRTKFVGGADFSFPSLKLGPLYTRVDAEAIVSANFGAVSTLVPITVNEIYAKPLPAGSRVYVGAGIGPYFGEVTRFGGKIFVGGDFNRTIGVEADVQFAGQGDALVTVAARLGL